MSLENKQLNILIADDEKGWLNFHKENLNFLKVKTKTKTTAKTVHSSAYQTHLSTGFIPLRINNHK